MKDVEGCPTTRWSLPGSKVGLVVRITCGPFQSWSHVPNYSMRKWFVVVVVVL